MGDKPEIAVATVYYCPEGEKISHDVVSTNFRLAAETTFFDILQNACIYYQHDIADMVLRNQAGSIWPVKDRVAKGLKQQPGGQIRLTPNDMGDESTVAEEEAVEEEKVEDHVDDGRVVAARPPLYRELVLHFIFLSILITDTYIVPTKPVFRTHQALEQAFILPQNSRQPVMDSAQEAVNDFSSIYTTRQMCSWLTERLTNGLFNTDLNDAWGDVEVFNRIAGGVTIQSSFQRWQNASEAYEAGRPCANLFSGCSPPVDTMSIREPPLQIPLNFGRQYDANGTLLSNGTESNITAIFKGQVESLTDTVCRADRSAFNETQVMRSTRVTLLFHNHNYDLFFSGTFLFDMKPSGQVKPNYSFRSFRLEPPWGSWVYEFGEESPQFFRRLRMWLTFVNYILVFLRTFNEFNAGRKVLKDTGSIRPYLSGVFTLLELFNLTCNYIGLVFRIYEQVSSQRLALEGLVKTGETHLIQETAVDMIIAVAGIILTARALSIISAMLLMFKYLELAPKRFFSSIYLTGTTLGRAGRDLQVVLLLFLVVLVAFALVGFELFGNKVEEFSSIPNAFFTLCICVAGSGFIYTPLRTAFPTLGPLFFVVFTMTHLLVITPLFLATLNDAYAVRDEQMRQAEERRQAMRERKEEEARLRRKIKKGI